MILVADVGGTKTHVALFKRDVMVEDKIFSSRNYSSLESLLKDFFQNKKILVEKAAFGVPGIVMDGKCDTTNLPWSVKKSSLEKELGVQIFLLNDLEAASYAISVLKEDDFFILNRGVKRDGNRALISAGTGLGEAGILSNGSIISSEGGHQDFAVQNEEGFHLFSYMKKKYGHVSYERVVSGQGLVDIYDFLNSSGENLIIEDPSIISQKAVKKECQLCEKALDLFISFYGREASNLALKFLAFGGVYIGGGIAPKILRSKGELFMKSFCDKGRFSQKLKTIPVKLILNEKAPLMGAFYYIQETSKKLEV